uniref:Cytochrome b n=1 Tax=Romanomermis culicivorax TaxID=13658 RepID=A0A915JTM2_ROMCU
MVITENNAIFLPNSKNDPKNRSPKILGNPWPLSSIKSPDPTRGPLLPTVVPELTLHIFS